MGESLRKFDTSSVRQGRRKWRATSGEQGKRQDVITQRRCGAEERGEEARNKRKPRGVACVANKGLINSDFGSVASKGVTGEFHGSVANKGLRGVLERSRGMRGRDATYRAADGH